jgi:hypothetical protein
MKMPTNDEINRLPRSLSAAAVAAHFGIPSDLVISARAKTVKPFSRKPLKEERTSINQEFAHAQMMKRGSDELLARTLKLIAKLEGEIRSGRKNGGVM